MTTLSMKNRETTPSSSSVSDTEDSSLASGAAAAGIPDVQGRDDERQIAIDRVGVKDVTYPITLRTPSGGSTTAVASIDMYVSLPHDRKGTHMSRFLEILNENRQGIQPGKIIEICHRMKERLDARDSHLRVEFTYFIEKLAPVTNLPGLMDYEVVFECSSNCTDDFLMTVRAPATSLCPCSKEISKYGAHNQRCLLEAQVRFEGELWIEDVVRLLERAASAELYSVLKRPDEKYVTELAYEQPKFVEDIIRDAAHALNAEDRIVWYRVRSENFESIHNHNAYAEITCDKRAK